MQVYIEKTDDINISLIGTVRTSLIEKKTSELRTESSKKNIKDSIFYQREAEAQILQEFIDSGLKDADISLDELLGQPYFKTYKKEAQNLHLEIQLTTKPVIHTNVNYMDVVPSFKMPKANPKTVESKLSLLAK